jgi:SAM-dependent methyltransferase
MTWPYDLTAEFYDEDMGRNNDGRDIAWYVGLAITAPGSTILELGSGTGRVTLPLAQAGFTVVAVDCSVPMLRVLADKSAAAQMTQRIAPLAMDMGKWSIATPYSARFAAILCPFSAFTYLVDDDDRTRMLAGVRACLAPGGVLALDTFIPDVRLDALNDGTRIEDYRRALPERWRPAVTLARSKRLTHNVRPGINRIQRQYRFLDAQGAVLREVETESFQRPYAPAELLATLTAAGFTDLQTCGDFDAATPARAPARTIAVVARLVRP